MAASTVTTTVLPPVKSVMVYRNGDPFYSGRRFVVNQRQVATMEAFLNEVTRNIGAPLAVRTLYTPRQGTRISDLQDLQAGAQYVAAGFEKFKKLDYLNVGAKKLPAGRKVTQAKIMQKPNVSAKWRKFIPVPCIIHVFRNGDLLCPPFRFIIPRTMQQDLEQILSLVTEKVSLRTGAVRRLCSLEGATVSSAGQLETGHCYVAVGTERFKKLPYVELLVSKATERYYPGKRRLLRMENRKAGSGPEDQYSDSALLNSPESDGRRVKSTGDEAAPPQAAQESDRRLGADEMSPFFARPVKIQKNRGQTKLPLSNGSVQPSIFKRAARKRREEMRGAEEVHEDENTATELPVDQRVAEVVDEELSNTDDSLHITRQRCGQIIEGEQHNEREHPQKSVGKQGQSSEQSAVEQSDDSARTEWSAAETMEPELQHTSSTPRPSSSSSQGKTREEKDSLQDILSNSKEQTQHQHEGFISEVTPVEKHL
ncbi:doublecortin domain-containing protein 2B [Echeneis naucrates]|uniref:doublecortin domain-containing protein 2B n=1 Tax=Echeneis naucrates TaxID=173247 RepID=UPI001113BE12|nr:doublecortin domain-containing protein 2B-like [Echeneis naucrates]